jgi:taurine dioxygenase
MKMSHSLQVRTLSPYLGADLMSLDLARVIESDDRKTVAQIQEALDTYIMIRLRGQQLTPAQMERFGAHFGPFLSLKRPERPDAEHIPGIQFLKIISNAQTADGRPLGDGSAAAQDWHTDGAMKPIPATYSHFYARIIPPNPPKTYWMNTYLVYESLPANVKERIGGLRVIHHHYSAGNEYPLPPSLPLEKRMTGPQHPLVRKHPATGRPILYLPHRDDALIVGMSVEESYELIRYLRRFAAESPFWFGVALEKDDLVIWDNRACLHRRDGWDPTLERTVWHLTNEGEVPIAYFGDARAA